jgi:hypothetical protein
MRQSPHGHSSVATATLVAVVTGLTGLAANLLTNSRPDSDFIITVLALGVSILSLGAATVSTKAASRRSDEVRATIESADRQSDIGLFAAEQAGVDATRLYGQLVHDTTLPAEVRYIYGWSRLEAVMRSTVRGAKADDMAGRPIGSLIAAFAEVKGLSEEDKNRLRALLKIRNEVVHGGVGDVSTDTIEQALKDLDTYAGLTSRGS